MGKYMASYGYDGGRWTLFFYAADREDAERRLAAIKAWCALDGEVKAEIPVPTTILQRFVAWLHGARPNA